MSVLFLALGLLFAAVGCSEQPPQKTSVQKFFEGEHIIQKMMPFISQEGHISGSGAFFLFAGAASITGQQSTKYEVKFAWKSNEDDTFVISSFPLEKIRVKLNPGAKYPVVSFKIYQGTEDGSALMSHGYGQQEVIDRGYIEYALITVRPEDWPLHIQMPLQPR